MITKHRKNAVGTLSFTAKFAGMRKEQEFIVYPMQDSGAIIKIQSDSRIGQIDLDSGAVELSGPRAGGAFFHHFNVDKALGKVKKDVLPEEERKTLRQKVKETGGLMVGGSVVKCENIGAMAL